MNYETHKRWTHAVAEEIGAGERIKALVILRRPEKVNPAEVVVGGAIATSGSNVEGIGQARAGYVLLAATDLAVHVWDVNGEELGGRVAEWPLDRARLKLKWTLFGRRLTAGAQQVYNVPLGAGSDARAVVAAAR